MNRTPIEWCRTYNETGTFFEVGFSVNPVRFRPRGSQTLVTMCQKVSPGCTHCYAETITRRFWPKDAKHRVAHRLTMGTELVPISFPGYTAAGVSENSGEFVLDEKTLLSVLKRKKPARIFWGDMTDLFQESVPDVFLDRCFAVCALTPHLTHMFLTKRPERMYSYFGRSTDILNQVRAAMIGCQVSAIHLAQTGEPVSEWSGLPMPNVWLGTSVENQEYADKRIPLLLQTPAAVHFISAEPLLGHVDMSKHLRQLELKISIDPEMAEILGEERIELYLEKKREQVRREGPNNLDWVIVGGESGAGARPMHPDWARSLRDQCKAAGVPFFFKQWGEWKPISEMPESEYDALYRSNRVANDGEDQGSLDEMHGRTCKVAVEYLNFAGETGIERGFQQINGHGGVTLFRIGKKAAGALLDGVEYREFPEVRG